MKRTVALLEKVSALKERSFDDLVRWLYQPTDPSSLGVIRFLFGEQLEEL